VPILRHREQAQLCKQLAEVTKLAQPDDSAMACVKVERHRLVTAEEQVIALQKAYQNLQGEHTRMQEVHQQEVEAAQAHDATVLKENVTLKQELETLQGEHTRMQETHQQENVAKENASLKQKLEKDMLRSQLESDCAMHDRMEAEAREKVLQVHYENSYEEQVAASCSMIGVLPDEEDSLETFRCAGAHVQVNAKLGTSEASAAMLKANVAFHQEAAEALRTDYAILEAAVETAQAQCKTLEADLAAKNLIINRQV